jgi:hypothetical protein
MAMRYSARRRQGVKGVLGIGSTRGEVVDANGSTVMETRSAQLADVVARLLNGEGVERRGVDDQAVVPRYQLAHGVAGGRCAIVGIESTVRDGARFGEGVLALTGDEALAAKVAAMLNDVDPRRRPRVRRGMGWW